MGKEMRLRNTDIATQKNAEIGYDICKFDLQVIRACEVRTRSQLLLTKQFILSHFFFRLSQPNFLNRSAYSSISSIFISKSATVFIHLKLSFCKF